MIENPADAYCAEHSTTPSKYCKAIYDYTKANVEWSQMLVGPLEGAFLGFMVSALNAKSILEIGCFTGYSALSMAERLPKNGKLFTFDVNEKTQAIAKSFWKKSPHGKKITPFLGDTIPTLKKWVKQKKKFDLIFIDANKDDYATYFELGFQMLSKNGIILVDNCLWGGKVLDPTEFEPDTIAIRKLNDLVAQRKTAEKVLLPIRDGVFMVRKIS